MQEGLPKATKNLYSIGEASHLLGVSIDTIRRWEQAGKIQVIRSPGGTRLIPSAEIERFKKRRVKPFFKIREAADELGVSIQTLRRWDKDRLIQAKRSPGGTRFFPSDSIQTIKTQKPPHLLLPPGWFEKAKTQPPEQKQLRTPIPDKTYQKIIHYIKYIRPGWYQRYHESPIHRPLHFAILGVFLLLMANILFGSMIEEALKGRVQSQPDLGQLLAAVTPPRILSFQGRLTDDSDVPIVAPTTVVFRIWDQEGGGTEGTCTGAGGEDCLWKSKIYTITPDSNGIFSVCLGGQDTGDDCLIDASADTIIPATLFSDNAALYLGVKAGADSEMTPRQRIAASSYALNSDTLDGVDSLSFLRSDASDTFSGGTLTLTFAGTQNLAITSDLAGTVNVISAIGTPSGSAGTTRGLAIQQANHASNTNGLDAAILIDNADADLAIADAILITNTGGGGTPYTNLFNSPTLDISGAGAITGATGITSSGTITFSSYDTDANAVLYTHPTGGVVTRVVETETGSQCLLSGAGVSGVPVWGSCSAGSQTPWGQDIDAEGFDLTDLSNILFRETTGAPAGTDVGLFRDNTGDLNLNVLTGKSFNVQVNGSDEYNFSSTGLEFNSNNITGLGTSLTAAGALTISSTTASAITLDSGTTGNVNLGTGNNAKTIAIGTGTAGNTFNIGTNNTTKDTINIGSALDDVAITGDQWSVTNAGVLTVASCTGCGGGATVKSGVRSVTEGTPVTVTFATAFSTTPYCAVSVDLSGSGAAAGGYAWLDSAPTTTAVVFNYSDNAGGAAKIENVNWICTDAGDADLAEIYPTNDTTIQPGELVSIDPNLENGVLRTTKAYDKALLGVVSTSPAITIGGTGGVGKWMVPVALVGRVPVKVSNENGPIAPGDLLTSSSTPGAAMKATKAGYVIGRALTGFSGDGDPSTSSGQEGVVLAFVNTHYTDPQMLDFNFNDNNETPDILSTPEVDINLTPLGLDSENNLVATISANTKFIWQNAAGSAVSWISNTGEAFFAKVTALVGDFQKLVFGELAVRKDSQVAGEAGFSEGEMEVFITSNKVEEDSLINLTPASKTDGLSLYIKDKKVGKGFTVALERSSGDLPTDATASAAVAIKFNWFILNQE